MRPYSAKVAEQYEKLFLPDKKVYFLIHAMQEYSLSRLPENKNAKILDVACGQGQYCIQAALRGYTDVTGLDISDSQISYAKTLADQHSISATFVQRDVRALGSDPAFQGKFDHINASWLYDNAVSIKDFEAMVQSVHSCLRPGGVHTGITVNFNVLPSRKYEYDMFGVSLMDDCQPEIRPQNGDIIRGKFSVSSKSEINDEYIVFEALYIDAITFRKAFSQQNYRKLKFLKPKDWLFASNCLSHIDTERFYQYCEINPEMIAFSSQK